MSQSLEQRRAAHALRKAQQVVAAEGELAEAAQQVKSIPAMIVMTGLGQALAVVKVWAASSSASSSLNNALTGWLREGYPGSPLSGTEADILTALVTGSQAQYVWAQEEALAYLGWLKKFLVAFDEERKRKEDEEKKRKEEEEKRRGSEETFDG